MRIEIVVSEWEHACCGAAIRVGGPGAWTVIAADPAESSAAELAAGGPLDRAYLSA